jgi:hypothetical protein
MSWSATCAARTARKCGLPARQAVLCRWSTSLEEGIKVHRFAGIFPEQFSTEAGRQREAVVAADQRMVISYYGDDLAFFVHDVSHVTPPIQRAGIDRVLVQAMQPNNGTLGSSCM